MQEIARLHTFMMGCVTARDTVNMLGAAATSPWARRCVPQGIGESVRAPARVGSLRRAVRLTNLWSG